MLHRPKSSVNISTGDTSLTIINDNRSKAESDDDEVQIQEHEMDNIDDKEKAALDV